MGFSSAKTGCAGTHDGALQQTARFIDSLGFNAVSYTHLTLPTILLV